VVKSRATRVGVSAPAVAVLLGLPIGVVPGPDLAARADVAGVADAGAAGDIAEAGVVVGAVVVADGLVGGQLDPVADIELGEQVGDVRLDGRFREVKFGRDLGVRLSGGHEREDTSFAVGECVQPAGAKAGWWFGYEPIEQPLDQRRREQDVTAGDASHGVHQVGGCHVFEEEPGSFAVGRMLASASNW